jgi:hypothetical protein
MQDVSESWRRAAAEMETLCDALGVAFWDAMRPEEATEEDAAEIWDILSALHRALAPWQREIVAVYRAHRTERGRRVGCREERLLGVVLPAIPMARQQADEGDQ